MIKIIRRSFMLSKKYCIKSIYFLLKVNHQSNDLKFSCICALKRDEEQSNKSAPYDSSWNPKYGWNPEYDATNTNNCSNSHMYLSRQFHQLALVNEKSK